MPQASLNPVEATLARLLNRRLRRVITPTDLTPVRITVIYAVLGFGALYFSDVYLAQIIHDEALLARLQALKGGAEVALTAGVILLLTSRSRRAIETRNDRLETLRAERNVLHRVFRHNLRQDLNIIMGYCGMIRDGTSDAEILENCEKMLDRIGQIERYQEKIVDIERVLDPPTELKRMDLTELIRSDSLVQELQHSEDVTISMDLPDESPVIASSIVRTAFHEVIENAIEHNTAAAPTVRVSIEEDSEDLVDLIVEDNGPGISEYERLALAGMREEGLTHSSGLGLWLAKLACRVSGGSLDIPEQYDGGGKVVLELPEAPGRTIQRRLPAIAG